MNLLKKFGILACFGTAVLALGSCTKFINNGVDVEKQVEKNDAGESDKFDFENSNMTSISIVESTAKKKFYLGDEFSSEGLTANVNFVGTVNGERTSASFQTQDLTVDYSNVDFYNVGTYPVKVQYRYRKTVRNTTYDVQVISSEFDDAGIEYVGGIEVTYANKKAFDYDLDLTGTKKININQFRVKAHYYKNGVEIEDKAQLIDKSNFGTTADAKVFIDYSNVNLKKRGTYIAKITYTADPVTINGKSVPNKVNSFVLINVNDEVETFSFYSGTTTYVADVTDVSFSDWKFKVTRKISGDEIVDYDPEMFTITGVSPFVVGVQKASIVCKELPNLARGVNVTITESQKYNIVTGNIYTVSTDAEGNAIYGGEVFKKLEDLGGTATEGTYQLDSSGVFSVTNATKYEDRKAGADKYGSLNFGQRITIKKESSYISIKVDGPARIVVYAASTGDNSSRDVGLYSVDGSLLYDSEGNELQYFTDEGNLKQVIEQFVFDVDAAGTYLLKSELQVYVNGFVVAMEK